MGRAYRTAAPSESLEVTALGCRETYAPAVRRRNCARKPRTHGRHAPGPARARGRGSLGGRPPSQRSRCLRDTLCPTRRRRRREPPHLWSAAGLSTRRAHDDPNRVRVAGGAPRSRPCAPSWARCADGDGRLRTARPSESRSRRRARRERTAIGWPGLLARSFGPRGDGRSESRAPHRRPSRKERRCAERAPSVARRPRTRSTAQSRGIANRGALGEESLAVALGPALAASRRDWVGRFRHLPGRARLGLESTTHRELPSCPQVDGSARAEQQPARAARPSVRRSGRCRSARSPGGRRRTCAKLDRFDRSEGLPADQAGRSGHR